VCLKNNTVSCYTWRMDKKSLQKILDQNCAMVWDSLCELYPRLVRFNEPKILINGRLWRNAGFCYQTENKIELGLKFFNSNQRNFNYMMRVILPHEIIHQADWNLFGESELPCGHGEKWREIMLNYGLPDNPFHSMDIKR